MVRTGKLRTKAVFEQYTPPIDHFGKAKGEWTEVFQEFVQLEPLSGRELLQAQQIQSQTTHKATFHFRTDIDTKMRLRVERPGVIDADPTKDSDWRIFHIESLVNVNEQNRELQLMLIEKT